MEGSNGWFRHRQNHITGSQVGTINEYELPEGRQVGDEYALLYYPISFMRKNCPTTREDNIKDDNTPQD